MISTQTTRREVTGHNGRSIGHVSYSQLDSQWYAYPNSGRAIPVESPDKGEAWLRKNHYMG